MVEEHITGIIKDIDENGTLTILAGVPSVERALLRQYKTCSIILEDGRRITPKQRAKCYALLGEIDEYVNGLRTAEGQEEQKNLLKLRFMLDCMTEAERKMFSLADCSETTARAFITYIIDFIVRNDIPTQLRLYEQCEDIGQYVYACLLHKKCAVCGRRADLHHAEGSRIGMGGDRREAHHLGRLALPLCREHHTMLHDMPEANFLAKYHLEPVKIDERICKLYGLKK